MTKLFSRACALSLVVALAACNSSTPANDAAVSTDVNNIPTFDVGNDAASVADAGPCGPTTLHVTVLPTAPSGAYSFNGGTGDPTLTLCRGVTYTFDLSGVSALHPLEIKAGTTLVATIEGGQTGSYTVPTMAPFPDTYDCRIHGFGGTVTTVAAP